MNLGVTFPQTDIEPDAHGIHRFAETTEDLGFTHLLAYDHVLGVEPPDPDWDGVYDYTDAFYEPLTLFAYAAAATDHLNLITGVLVLPQREAILVAKQTATLDVLSDGRLTLGVGVGWNDLEYQNLGMDFHTRGARIEEQVAVLRELWQHPLVTYHGEWHDITAAGINPLPVQQPIPVWMGGGKDVVLRRIARLADGWVAPGYRPPAFEGKTNILHDYLRDQDRDPDTFPINARVTLAAHDPDDWIDTIQTYADLGATQISIVTMRMGHQTIDDHLDTIREFAEQATDAGLL